MEMEDLWYLSDDGLKVEYNKEYDEIEFNG
jgi:uncharacterized protein YneR